MPNAIPLLLETIKIEEGIAHNLAYHQQRLHRSRQALLGTQNILDLQEHIIAPSKGCYRCRVLYDYKIHSIEYIPYQPKMISNIQLIETPISYNYKYADRSVFEALQSQASQSNEVLIVKNGYLTDTTIANIALYNGDTWVTPKKPLLRGTMREKLLDEGFLKTKEIKEEDLSEYTQVALMNAMIGFKILKNITIVDTQGNIYDY